eukprot:TRINITY_DN13253_c0_g1_i1.p1 TRINITY_DN13253_c0_g1~~TRINITY_DN13253_c0_g1_i1.p1  ORF type:complete len:447 (+),score=71.21 TRINITY_DN13253_c0_g1_i1:153-1343(+)
MKSANVIVFHGDAWIKRWPKRRYTYKGQLYALFGHEPTWKNSLWLDSEWTSMFDVSFHWGRHSDVPLSFFLLDSIYFKYFLHSTLRMELLRERQLVNRNKGKELTVLSGNRNSTAALYRNQSVQFIYSNETTALTYSLLTPRWWNWYWNGISDVLPAETNTERREFWEKRLTEHSSQHDALRSTDRNNDSPLPGPYIVSALVRKCNKERSDWMKEFMQGVPTASMGGCENNVPGDHMITDEPNMSEELRFSKLKLISSFPFHLAIESKAEAGFVTEKIFEAFVAGVVPIYVGASQDVIALAPPNSFIDASRFPTPKILAQYVNSVARNITAYMEYHRWREDENATKALFERNIANGRLTAPCRLCQYWRSKQKSANRRFRDRKMYYDPDFGWNYGS